MSSTMESCEVEEFDIRIAIIEPHDTGFEPPIKIFLVQERVIV